jgi:hypothetical protein
MVKPGVVGFYPIKPLNLSYIHSGYSDLVIGAHDLPDTKHLKQHPSVVIQQGKSKETLDLTGKVFNGFSDAFYRGRLPQVFVALPDAGAIFHFLDEFFDYLEKLYSLGFFLQKKDPMAAPVDPVDQYIPCFLLGSNGIFYSSFLKKLAESLENIPQIDELTERKILSKFCRGIFEPNDWRPFTKGAPVELEEARHIRLAGGSPVTQSTIQYILKARGLSVTIEDKAENPVERLELENALRRSVEGFLPALNREGHLSESEAEAYQRCIQDTITSIGRVRKAFGAEESADWLLGKPAKPASKGKSGATPMTPHVIPGDSSILSSLIKYAEILNLEQEKEGFQALKTKVLEQLRKSP